jgi:hypothetical protein
MFSSRPQKPLKEWTQQELRRGLIAIYTFALFFLTATGLLIWQIGVFSLPVIYFSIIVVVLFIASRPLHLELRQRRGSQS